MTSFRGLALEESLMENTCMNQGALAGSPALFRRWLDGSLDRLRARRAARQGAAELRAMDCRELHDLGLDRGGIAYASLLGRNTP